MREKKGGCGRVGVDDGLDPGWYPVLPRNQSRGPYNIYWSPMTCTLRDVQ